MLILTAALLFAVPDVSVAVEPGKTLKVKKGELLGVISVRVKNRGAEPVDLQHRDVHGFLFTPKKGAPSVILHSCDCAFELGLEPQPAQRTFTLAPGEERVLRFDDFACGGGAHKAPAPGQYQLTFRLGVASQATAEKKTGKLDLKECERLLISRAAEGLVSPPIAIKISRP